MERVVVLTILLLKLWLGLEMCAWDQSIADASSNATGLANTHTLVSWIGKTTLANSIPDTLSAGVKNTTFEVKLKISFPTSIGTLANRSPGESPLADSVKAHTLKSILGKSMFLKSILSVLLFFPFDEGFSLNTYCLSDERWRLGEVVDKVSDDGYFLLDDGVGMSPGDDGWLTLCIDVDVERVRSVEDGLMLARLRLLLIRSSTRLRLGGLLGCARIRMPPRVVQVTWWL